jgi:MFS family permease
VVEQPQGPSGSESWLSQFPAPLRDVAMVRLIAALGAGGVLYLTPLVFHQGAFSATQITAGLALAALAGTGGRLLCGALLDQGLRCSVPVLLAAASAIAGDILLLLAQAFPAFAAGQVLLGIAAGLYWPAIELVVPLTCPPLPSARAFALVRTADAAGIAIGALAGAALAAADRLRGIYGFDIACLVALVLLLLWHNPRLTIPWLSVVTVFVGVELVTRAQVRYLYTGAPLVAVALGWCISPFWRKGFAARLLVVLVVGYIGWVSGALWIDAVMGWQKPRIDGLTH